MKLGKTQQKARRKQNITIKPTDKRRFEKLEQQEQQLLKQIETLVKLKPLLDCVENAEQAIKEGKRTKAAKLYQDIYIFYSDLGELAYDHHRRIERLHDAIFKKKVMKKKSAQKKAKKR